MELLIVRAAFPPLSPRSLGPGDPTGWFADRGNSTSQTLDD